METNNLNFKQRLIHTMTEALIKDAGFNALDTNIGRIKYFANELAKDTEEKKEVTETNSTYPEFREWMSKRTILCLHHQFGIDTPEQLAKFDFNYSIPYGFKPNIELLQYAMKAGIKLKNYQY